MLPVAKKKKAETVQGGCMNSHYICPCKYEHGWDSLSVCLAGFNRYDWNLPANCATMLKVGFFEGILFD